ncbi:hypothetical protein LAZ67_17000841 [Cordylochernes scorpioides]|uniref:Amino acid transporter transmembrane domain-containing protein n=1 Tax=Cordylochernes scorpioides TaxID=51811 RepID=A0ABY6LF30_9ARAC|nr:hypothetical protein LAZ67_17000841 [Cordylochernes scorpioides]
MMVVVDIRSLRLSDIFNLKNENEVPKKHKGLSVFMVIMFIMGEQAGAGMMAISRAFVDTEWYGVAILLYYSVVAGLMGILLGKSWMIVEERWPQYKSQKCGNPYPTMGEKAVAPWMRIPVSICSYFSLLGGDVVYILVISKFLQQMFPQLGMSFCVWIVLLSLILLPFTFLGSPHDFCQVLNMKCWRRFIAVLAISTTAVCCVLALLQMYYEFTAVTHVPAPAAVMTTDHFFLALSTFSFAYAGTPAFPSFQNDMKNRNKFSLAVIIAYIGLILMYVSMGLAGKYVYGDRVSGNVLESLSASPLRTAAQVLIIIHFAAAFQIMVNSPAQEIEEYLKLPKKLGWHRIVTRTILVAFLVLICETIPEFSKILHLVGAFAGTSANFIFPPLFYLLLCRPKGDWPGIHRGLAWNVSPFLSPCSVDLRKTGLEWRYAWNVRPFVLPCSVDLREICLECESLSVTMFCRPKGDNAWNSMWSDMSVFLAVSDRGPQRSSTSFHLTVLNPSILYSDNSHETSTTLSEILKNTTIYRQHFTTK